MKYGNHRYPTFALAITFGMLVGASGMPYGYYNALRLATFAAGALYAYLFWEKDRKLAYWLIGFAIIFNPINPFHLHRDVWVPINLLGAVMFGSVAWKLRRPVPDDNRG